MDVETKEYVDSSINSKIAPLIYQIDCVQKVVDDYNKSSHNDAIWRAKYGEKIENIEKDFGEMKKTIEKMSESIDALKDVPRKRYNGAIGSLIGAIIAGIVTAVFAFFKLK